MTHVRIQLEDSVKSQIATHASSVSGRIFTGREEVFSETDYPLVTVEAGASNVNTDSNDSLTSRLQNRTFRLEITVLDQASNWPQLKADMSEIAVEIEYALGRESVSNLVITDMRLVSDDAQMINRNDEGILGAVSLSYEVEIYTREGNAAVAV